jgi:hypothetical protein
VGHADWSNFLIAEAGGAAALTGLIFVAVSINLAKILEYPGVSTRAAEAILVLLGVLLVSSIALVPSESDRVMGFSILAIGGALWLTVTATQIRFRFPQANYRVWWFLTRVAFSQLAILPFCIAGVGLILGWHNAMYWLVPGCLFSFVAGVHSAWVLLIEIMR